jgi:AcrR family transcriptional regulator
VSHPATESASLRERKKLRLRRGLQHVALRLFAAQGYDETTVEQIVTEAESSLATFYRHFPTKEDVVLYDEFDPLIEQAIAQQPADEPVTGTIRAVVAALARAVEANREQSLTRIRLIAAAPALMARQALDERKNYELYSRILAAGSSRPADDYQLRLASAALSAALTEAARYWAEHDGTPPLSILMDQAVTTLEPLLRTLYRPAAPATGKAATEKPEQASQDRR